MASSSSSSSPPSASMREYFNQNKLKVIGGFWAASVAGTLAYQWRKPIPTNLKIIHARVVAQAACLAGLAAIATVEYFDHKAELKTVAARLEAVEAHVGRGKE